MKTKEQKLVRKYSNKVNEYNKVIEIYNNSFFPSLYNSNKSYSNNIEIYNNNIEIYNNSFSSSLYNSNKSYSSTNKTITTNNKVIEWNEFYLSKDVWHTLGRRPRMKDFIDYKHNRLIIREVVQ